MPKRLGWVTYTKGKKGKGVPRKPLSLRQQHSLSHLKSGPDAVSPLVFRWNLFLGACGAEGDSRHLMGRQTPEVGPAGLKTAARWGELRLAQKY